MCIPKELKYLAVDASQCMGCRNCELACCTRKVEHYGNEAKPGDIRIMPNIIIGHDGNGSKPAYCRHCSEAFCAKLCPVNATIKVNGVILFDKTKCNGCGICEQACPYGVITIGTFKINEITKKLATKCDLCIDRRINDEEPACYAACPTKALQMV